MHKRNLEIAATELKKNLENIINMELPKIEDALKAAGAPWFDGQPIPEY